jgi:hypothetical protein
MATVQILVCNPTSTNVTVNAKVAVARKTTQLGLDDTTTEAEQFLAAKCALVSVTAQSDLSARMEAVYRLFRQAHAG